eukprot:5971079-Alexandrium_andersonii.AAC.1
MTFPASMPESEQRAEVARRVESWLATKEELFDGITVLVEGGEYDPSTYDASRPMEYSREETRVTDAQAQVTAAVDRPLRHVTPWVFCD